MKAVLFTVAVLAAAGPVRAEGLRLKPLADARLRYEHVDQDGLPANADALTLRMRGGLSVGTGPFAALVEAQGTLAVVDRYGDGLGNGGARPLVADPQNVALYRAQFQYKTKAITLTAGRSGSRWTTNASSARLHSARTDRLSMRCARNGPASAT
jgi:hypothetical protein